MELIRYKRKDFFKNTPGIKASNVEEKIQEVLDNKSYKKDSSTVFTLVPIKGNSKRHYFENKNFLKDVKNSYKLMLYFSLLNTPLVLLVFLLFYWEMAMVLGQVLIIYLICVLFVTIFAIFGASKKLILKNKFIYETDFLGDRKQKFEFKNMNILVLEKVSVIYFHDSDSPIFVSVGKSKIFEDFFRSYFQASIEIKGNRLIA